jgi:hypothetical protein
MLSFLLSLLSTSYEDFLFSFSASLGGRKNMKPLRDYSYWLNLHACGPILCTIPGKLSLTGLSHEIFGPVF